MCGIAYVSSTSKSAKTRIEEIYKAQKERGAEGFGFVAIDGTGKVKKVYRSQNEKSVLEKLRERKERTILFHHRFPTSTPNITEASHPIRVHNSRLEHDYFVVHNGIISNCDDLRDEHIKLGYKYTTDIEKVISWTCQEKTYTNATEQYNDSEALAVELAEYIEGRKKTMDAHGSIAFIAVQVKNGIATRLYYGRNERSPLIETKTSKTYTLSSEAEHAQNVEPHVLHWYEYASGLKGRQAMEMDRLPTVGFHAPYSDYGYGGHGAYTSLPAGNVADYSYSELRAQGYSNDDILYEVEDELQTTEELLATEHNKGMVEVYRARIVKLNRIIDVALADIDAMSIGDEDNASMYG